MPASRRPGAIGGVDGGRASPLSGGPRRSRQVMGAFAVPGPIGSTSTTSGIDGVLQGIDSTPTRTPSTEQKSAKGRVPHRNPPAEVVTLDGIEYPGKPRRVELEVNTAAAYERLVAHARQDGFAEPLFSIVSGYRSRAKQAVLYAKALEKYKTASEARKWVAPPGHSAHETGCAIDLWLGYHCTKEQNDAIKRTDAYAWLQQHATAHGFNPYEREGWHWEYYVGD